MLPLWDLRIPLGGLNFANKAELAYNTSILKFIEIGGRPMSVYIIGVLGVNLPIGGLITPLGG